MRRFISGFLLAIAALACAPAAHADDRSDVDAYLRQVADRADGAGGYVDPAVIAQGRLTQQQADQVLAQARRQPSDVRVFVLPVGRLRVDQGGVTTAHLAYRPPALVARLHALVGKPGTYAVLTSAPSQRAGQSFYAYQWPGDGPSYAVGAAARRAIACCAPDYHRMLQRFVALSSTPRHVRSPQVDFGTDEPQFADGSEGGGVPGFAMVAVLGCLAVLGVGIFAKVSSSGGGRGWAPSGSVAPDVSELRGPLGDEIEQVRQQISAADASTPTIPADDPAAARVAAARAALDQAHARLTTMASPADAQAVTAALADARYEVAAATALRDGRAVPPRTAPCFVDPRHGPSVTTRSYPPSGLTAPVPVCAACDASLAVGTSPPPRTFLWGGRQMYPWTAYGPAWWYLMGYWGQQPFLGDLSHHQEFLASGHHHPNAAATGGGGWFGSGPGGAGGGPHHGGGGGFGGGGGRHGGFGGGGLSGGLGGGTGGGHHGGGGGFGGGGGGHGGGHHG